MDKFDNEISLQTLDRVVGGKLSDGITLPMRTHHPVHPGPPGPRMSAINDFIKSVWPFL